MELSLLLGALGSLWFFALQVASGGSFPKPLSLAEEQDCVRRAAEGDRAAKNKLIEHNLRLVVHIIKKYYSNAREQEDLLSIGTIGLIKAAGTFDYEKGTRFATYASRCIENEILMHFRARKKSAQDVYISDPIDTDKEGNSLTLQDVMADEGSIYEDIEALLRCERLHRAVNTLLEGREREIVVLRYGLFGALPHTQREVAKKLGISRSYSAVIIGIKLVKPLGGRTALSLFLYPTLP